MVMKLARPQSLTLSQSRREAEKASKQVLNPEIAKCKADFKYFVDTYCIIDDAQETAEGVYESTGQMPFHLWDDQRTVADDIIDNDRVIILKARQLGISWLVCAYVLWVCMFHAGKLALIFSKTENDANELIRRISVMYDRLPDFLRDFSPTVRRAKVSSIWFLNGSRAKAGAATRTAGSGETASVLVLDEIAKMQWARQLYTAAKPTIDNGKTKLIALSTAYGTGNLFHDIWIKAIEKKNNFRAIFLPWWSRPGRDQSWYDAKVAESTDPDEIKQEYPSNPIEAFLVSGRVRFKSAWVIEQAKNIITEDVRRDHSFLDDMDGLTVYRLPVAGQRVGIGADVAYGKEDGDYDCAVVVDLDTMEELACLHGQWEIDEYARMLFQLSQAYNAWIVVERNNHGHGVLANLRALNCPAIAMGHDGDQGWDTNVITKPRSIDELAIHLRDGLIIIHSAATISEIQQYRKLRNGATGAPDGRHDDRVMAWAILLAWVAYYQPPARARLVANPTDQRRWGT